MPLGRRVLGSRSSWKKAWAQAWSGLIRDDGVYSSRLATSSIASGGVRALNTYKKKSLNNPTIDQLKKYVSEDFENITWNKTWLVLNVCLTLGNMLTTIC